MHSDICIGASHLGTLEVQRMDLAHDFGAELEDGEWWIHLEDGWMDPDLHDRRKMLAKRVSSN